MRLSLFLTATPYASLKTGLGRLTIQSTFHLSISSFIPLSVIGTRIQTSSSSKSTLVRLRSSNSVLTEFTPSGACLTATAIVLSGPCDGHLPITTTSPVTIFLMLGLPSSATYVYRALFITHIGSSIYPTGNIGCSQTEPNAIPSSARPRTWSWPWLRTRSASAQGASSRDVAHELEREANVPLHCVSSLYPRSSFLCSLRPSRDRWSTHRHTSCCRPPHDGVYPLYEFVRFALSFGSYMTDNDSRTNALR